MRVVNCPAFCHRRPKLYTFAFISRDVLLLLSELDPHDGVDQLGFFPSFFRELASVLARELSMVFCRLLRVGLFSSQWYCADVVPIPNGGMSFFTLRIKTYFSYTNPI